MRLEGLVKTYGDTRAVDGVSLALAQGETLALLGPSGCGKSTLLRLVAGLETPDAGRIFLRDRDITSLPPQRRGFGMVFQDYALFPHLDVAGNIAFGLVEAGWSKGQRGARVEELLELVGLLGFGGRRVFELSGGQQQRVALARALAPEPPLLLLDEPLSNLDAALRDELKRELVEILEGLSASALFVTHDQSEAFTVADRVAVMRLGRLEGVGTPEGLFSQPPSAWTARFLGHENVFGTEHFEGLKYLCNPPLQTPFILLRSDLIRLGEGDFTATLLGCERVGAVSHLLLRLQPFGLRLRWSGFSRELPDGFKVGSELTLDIPEKAVVGLAGRG